jgi:hypothetical protein
VGGHVARMEGENCILNFSRKVWWKKNHFGDLGADGRITKDLIEIGCGNVDWINLAQNRVQLRVPVNPWVPIKGRISYPSKRLSASQDGYCSMLLVWKAEMFQWAV